MVGIRGRRLGAYETDGGSAFSTYVDADRFIVPSFNWVAGLPFNAFLPRGFKPRYVSGLSPTTGRRGRAIVPTLAADVWTGIATTFDVEATDGTIDTMTIVSRVGEKPPLP
jgi:hypothetical protein